MFLLPKLFLCSQVCRLAYELMQAMHGDATKMVKSLDFDYFFDGRRPYIVTQNHSARLGEIDLEVLVGFYIICSHRNRITFAILNYSF